MLEDYIADQEEKMTINKSIGVIYNLPAPCLNAEYSLELWYIELYNKQPKDITILDVIRMLQQHLLVELAIKKAINYLQEDPLAGSLFDGQLMETLLTMDSNKLKDSRKEIKKLVSEVSLKLNTLDWLCEEDAENFSNLLMRLQENVSEIK